MISFLAYLMLVYFCGFDLNILWNMNGNFNQHLCIICVTYVLIQIQLLKYEEFWMHSKYIYVDK